MKIRICAALLIALLSISLLTGCAPAALEARLERAEDAVAVKLEQAEEAAEAALHQSLAPAAPEAAAPHIPAATSAPESPAMTPPAATDPENRLSEDEVKQIALNHAGFAADGVKFLRVEPELYDRIPHYDVEFEVGRWEYEYEIHAETGKILSFEKDD